MIDESIIFHVATGSSRLAISMNGPWGGVGWGGGGVVSTKNKDKKGQKGKQLFIDESTENGQKDGIQTRLLD